jgi:hypothetical protein
LTVGTAATIVTATTEALEVAATVAVATVRRASAVLTATDVETMVADVETMVVDVPTMDVDAMTMDVVPARSVAIVTVAAIATVEQALTAVHATVVL